MSIGKQVDMNSTNLRVLCYSPYNLWPLHGTWEITILHALKLRGAELRYILCDALYTDCDVYRAAANPRHPMSCAECQSEVTSLMFRLGVQKYEWLGRYIPRDSYLIARQWANELNTEDLLKAKYNQWTIGEWIQSSVHTHLRIPHLDFDKPEIEKVFRSYLYSGLIACFGLTQLMNEYKPGVLLQFNGRMSSTALWNLSNSYIKIGKISHLFRVKSKKSRNT
jgi:hypothetical protein